MSNAEAQLIFFENLIAYLNEEDIINGVYVSHRTGGDALAIQIYSFLPGDRERPYVWLYLGWYECHRLLDRWGLLA